MIDTHSDTPWTLDTLRCATFYDLTQSVLGSVPGMAKEQAQQVAQKYIERTFATAAREELKKGRRDVMRGYGSAVGGGLWGAYIAGASAFNMVLELGGTSNYGHHSWPVFAVTAACGIMFLAVFAFSGVSARKQQIANNEAAKKIEQGSEGLAVLPLSEERYAHVERTVKDKILALRQGTAQLTL
jgi:hypothetical protein